MPWSPAQIAVVEEASFEDSTGGYHPDDVERLRTRVLLAMRRGHPLPNVDSMPLRRAARHGASVKQVEGLRTMLAVWAEVTPVEDPRDQARRAREAELAAMTEEYAERPPQWSAAQLTRVRERHFTRVGRQKQAYAERDVNTYLDSVVAAMRQGVEIPSPRHVSFESAGMRRGYDCKEVDDFLDELETMRPEG